MSQFSCLGILFWITLYSHTICFAIGAPWQLHRLLALLGLSLSSQSKVAIETYDVGRSTGTLLRVHLIYIQCNCMVLKLVLFDKAKQVISKFQLSLRYYCTELEAWLSMSRDASRYYTVCRSDVLLVGQFWKRTRLCLTMTIWSRRVIKILLSQYPAMHVIR